MKEACRARCHKGRIGTVIAQQRSFSAHHVAYSLGWPARSFRASRQSSAKFSFCGQGGKGFKKKDGELTEECIE
jgi:hypothetical protein